MASNEARPLAVLVVDDDDEGRRALKYVLTSQGLEVPTASGGDEALEVYRQRQAKIDLVLLDVDLPGLDGLQTLAELRRLDPTVRVIFLCTGDERYTYEELLKAGAVLVLSKPVDMAGLVAVVREMLASA